MKYQFEIHCPSEFKTEVNWVSMWLFGRLKNLSYKIIPCSEQTVKFKLNGKQLELPLIFFGLVDKGSSPKGALPKDKLNYWEHNWDELSCVINGFKIPILFGDSEFRKTSEFSWYLGIDLFGCCAYCLSRYEETIIDVRDTHDRFSAFTSHAYKNGYLEYPIADYYVEILLASFKKIWSSLNLDRKKFTFKISHDVDSPGLYTFRSYSQLSKSFIADLFFRRDFKAAYLAPYIRFTKKNIIHRSDPHNTFNWIMNEVEKTDSRSIFYFLAGRYDPNYDGEYNIQDPAILTLMDEIKSRGHEIGLHPSYTAAVIEERLVTELKNLRKALEKIGEDYTSIGARMHYLRWSVNKTWEVFDKLNIEHDASLGYADHIGFRAGTCHTFKGYSVKEKRILNIDVHPLTVMEASVIDKMYMNKGSGIEAFERINNIRSECKKVGGEFTLLWHNCRFVNEQERELFSQLLQTM